MTVGKFVLNDFGVEDTIVSLTSAFCHVCLLSGGLYSPGRGSGHRTPKATAQQPGWQRAVTSGKYTHLLFVVDLGRLNIDVSSYVLSLMPFSQCLKYKCCPLLTFPCERKICMCL